MKPGLVLGLGSRPAARLSGPTCIPSRPGWLRPSSSSSSTWWKSRRANDFFAREARVRGLKSRAAFKLLELNDKHKLFKPGQTVVDLGYAPGSWSQVAVDRTYPNGRVVGVDLIPSQPPRGVSTIQGNFLSPVIQDEVRAYVRDPHLGRPRRQTLGMERGYVDMERQAHLDGARAETVDPSDDETGRDQAADGRRSWEEREAEDGRVVDIVLSDMSAPWEQTTGFYKKSLSDPYFRMMNTSGNGFRDHAGSMDLCMAALAFSFDTLKSGGHFVCKYYQGHEEKAFESKLSRLFTSLHREKPSSSRAESKEAYFVALCRREEPSKTDVFRD